MYLNFVKCSAKRLSSNLHKHQLCVIVPDTDNPHIILGNISQSVVAVGHGLLSGGKDYDITWFAFRNQLFGGNLEAVCQPEQVDHILSLHLPIERHAGTIC